MKKNHDNNLHLIKYKQNIKVKSMLRIVKIKNTNKRRFYLKNYSL